MGSVDLLWRNRDLLKPLDQSCTLLLLKQNYSPEAGDIGAAGGAVVVEGEAGAAGTIYKNTLQITFRINVKPTQLVYLLWRYSRG